MAKRKTGLCFTDILRDAEEWRKKCENLTRATSEFATKEEKAHLTSALHEYGEAIEDIVRFLNAPENKDKHDEYMADLKTHETLCADLISYASRQSSGSTGHSHEEKLAQIEAKGAVDVAIEVLHAGSIAEAVQIYLSNPEVLQRFKKLAEDVEERSKQKVVLSAQIFKVLSQCIEMIEKLAKSESIDDRAYRSAEEELATYKTLYEIAQEEAEAEKNHQKDLDAIAAAEAKAAAAGPAPDLGDVAATADRTEGVPTAFAIAHTEENIQYANVEGATTYRINYTAGDQQETVIFTTGEVPNTSIFEPEAVGAGAESTQEIVGYVVVTGETATIISAFS